MRGKENDRKTLRGNVTVRVLVALAVAVALLAVIQRGGVSSAIAGTENTPQQNAPAEKVANSAVDFEHELDDYTPKKNRYNFYLTYKIVHPWWDAVALGMEDAQRQYLEKGITITYEYLAPVEPSAEDQRQRLLQAAKGPYDVIGVDVADEAVISPVIDELVAEGKMVMTFSSSDAAKGCKRIAYVGNTHNYEDGALLAEALCKKLGYKGKVAILVGTEGAPCHEDRARGVQDTIAKYESMEVVDVAYDHDSVNRARELTDEFLNKYKDLAGIVCCNMSNPVGAARAVASVHRNVAIVGMDHDREALRYLRDGVIYCLGVQDCYSIGFDTIQTAVKIADGERPGKLYPEAVDEKTTIIYQDDASDMLGMLYGELR